MHDCLKIQEQILDLVLNEIEPLNQKQLLDEVASCALCRAELESFEKTLTVYDRAAAFTQPTAAEWQTFQINLQNQFNGQKKSSASFWRQIVFGTIRVPAPVFAAAILLVSGIAVFAFYSIKKTEVEQLTAESAPTIATSTSVAADSSAVLKEPTEKIVVREVERVVTRKIYVVKKAKVAKEPKTMIAETPLETDSSPLNLAEFKPVTPAQPNVVRENKP